MSQVHSNRCNVVSYIDASCSLVYGACNSVQLSYGIIITSWTVNIIKYDKVSSSIITQIVPKRKEGMRSAWRVCWCPWKTSILNGSEQIEKVKTKKNNRVERNFEMTNVSVPPQNQVNSFPFSVHLYPYHIHKTTTTRLLLFINFSLGWRLLRPFPRLSL